MIPFRIRAATALILLAAVGWPAGVYAEDSFDRLPIRLSEERRREVLSGKTLVDLVEMEAGGLTEVVAIAILNAAPERLFEVVTDNEKFPEFMPYVKASRVERLADGSLINHQELGLPFPISNRNYSVRISNSVKGVGEARVWESAWSYIQGSGNIKESRGAWVLTEASRGNTLLLYRVFTDPGGLIPHWAYNLATRQSLPDLIDSVRRRARDPR